MKKLFLASILSGLIISFSDAQIKFGIDAGVNSAAWKGDAVNSINNIVKNSNGMITTGSRTGFHAGGHVSLPAGVGFSIEPGLQYSQKGFTMNGNIDIPALKFLGANAKAQVQAAYIDMPVILKATIAPGFSVYAGPQVSFLLKNNLHLNTGILGISVFNSNLDITNEFKKTDFAITGGLAYSFVNGVNIRAGYDYGLGKVDANSNFKSYNRVLKVGIGMEF